MKIEVSVDEKATDLKISVTCRQLTPDIEKILATLRMMNHQLTAKKDAEIYLLDTAQVIYIESVGRKCFIYNYGHRIRKKHFFTESKNKADTLYRHIHHIDLYMMSQGFEYYFGITTCNAKSTFQLLICTHILLTLQADCPLFYFPVGEGVIR